MAAYSSVKIEVERDNFFNLSLLLFRIGNQRLREFFKSQWPTVYQNKTGSPPPIGPWSDTPNDAIEMNKIETKLKFQFKDQKQLFDSGNTNDWDFSLLTTVLLNSSLGFVTTGSPESNAIKDMKEIRNKLIGHAPDAKISVAVYNTEWPRACQALKHFNATQEEFDDVIKNVEKPIDCIIPILKDLNLRLERNILDVIHQLQEEMKNQHDKIIEAITKVSECYLTNPPEFEKGNSNKMKHINLAPRPRTPVSDSGNSDDDDDKVACALCLCCWFVEFKKRNRKKETRFKHQKNKKRAKDKGSSAGELYGMREGILHRKWDITSSDEEYENYRSRPTEMYSYQNLDSEYADRRREVASYDDAHPKDQSEMSSQLVTLHELCQNDPTVMEDLARELDYNKVPMKQKPFRSEPTAIPTKILLEWLMMTQPNFKVSILLKTFKQLDLRDAFDVLQGKLSK